MAYQKHNRENRKIKNGRPYWIFRFKSESNNTVTNYTYRESDSYISPLVCRK